MAKKPVDRQDVAAAVEETPDQLPQAEQKPDDGQTTLSNVHEAVSYLDLEAQILDEQLKAIEDDPDARKHLHITKKNSGLPESLETKEKMVLEAYSAAPYVTPAGFRNPEDLEVFYKFLPIRPGSFPDTLMERLFDIQFQHSKDSIRGAEERKDYYPLLRRLLSTLKQMSFKPAVKGQKVFSKRIFVITGPEYSGLLVSRVPDKKRINNYHGDIYSAIRSQKHAMQQYTGVNSPEGNEDILKIGELELLKKMRFQTQQIIAALQMWKSSSLEERDNIKSLTAELESFLIQDINEYKVKARNHYKVAKTTKDRQIDRVNPGSTSARLVASFNGLQKRAAEIFKIMMHVSEDLDLMERARQSMEIAFNKTRLYLNTLLDRDYFKPVDELSGGVSYLKNNAASTNNELLDKKNPNKGVTVLLKELEDSKGTPSPFKEWAEAVLSNLRVVYKLNKKISSEKMPAEEVKITHNTICEFAIRAQLALKYQHIQQTFVQMLDEFLDHPERLDAEDVRKKLSDILKTFNPHAYGKKFQRRDDIKFIDESFQPMTTLIEEVIQTTHEWDIEKIKLMKQESKCKEKLSDSKSSGEAEVQELIELEDLRNDCDQKFRAKIYEQLKTCDFTKPIKSLTVERPV